MDIRRLVVMIIIAIVCAGVANILIPRRIPGKLVGLILIGLTGVWFGDWGFWLLKSRYGLDHAVLYWQIEGVRIIPAILGSTIILYVVTTLIKWGHYEG